MGRVKAWLLGMPRESVWAWAALGWLVASGLPYVLGGLGWLLLFVVAFVVGRLLRAWSNGQQP